MALIMKKLLFYLYFICFLLPLFLSSWEGELRVSGYHPTSEKFRRIYDEWIPQYQLEGSGELDENWKVWGNVAWLQKRGESEGLHNKTTLHLIPLSLGVKRVFCCNDLFSLYLGAGVSYAFLHIHDDSHYVIKHTSKRAWGAIFKSGIYVPISECFYLNLFTDYLYQPFHFSHHHGSPRVERHSINAGGWSVGLGVGARI